MYIIVIEKNQNFKTDYICMYMYLYVDSRLNIYSCLAAELNQE